MLLQFPVLYTLRQKSGPLDPARIFLAPTYTTFCILPCTNLYYLLYTSLHQPILPSVSSLPRPVLPCTNLYFHARTYTSLHPAGKAGLALLLCTDFLHQITCIRYPPPLDPLQPFLKPINNPLHFTGKAGLAYHSTLWSASQLFRVGQNRMYTV